METNMNKEMYIGKKCKVHILKENGKSLFYTADIIDYTDTHITFRDRDNLLFTFKLKDVEEIFEVQKE